MRVQTEEWRRFIPGSRMYKGKKTLFYNGEKLIEEDTGVCLIYDLEEQKSWQVIIVLPGVEVIPELTFHECRSIETVIMSDTVRRIEKEAFSFCSRLVFVKLSRNLEYMGFCAFWFCKSLTSIFIPPSCREIRDQLLILGLPQHTQLGRDVFQNTALTKLSPVSRVFSEEDNFYDSDNEETVIQWIKSINNGEAYALHRACSSFNPIDDIIHGLVKRKGIKAMRIPNLIGITPSKYLEANRFAEISEKDIINRYILDSMGEVI